MAVQNGSTNGNGHVSQPKIKLYTNHACPYAHRAHIALKELDLPFEEVIIDLDRPRDQWYLDLNPRGLVPTLEFSDESLSKEIITESSIVAQFLADVRPSHLVPASDSPKAALLRARIAFFVDTWTTKISSFMFPILFMTSMEEKVAKGKELIGVVEREIEPLLRDANPFFGGSSELTMAEVQVASFLIRMYTMANDVLLPSSITKDLDSLPNFSRWARAVMARESVTYSFDPDNFNRTIGARIEKMAQQKKTSFEK